MRPERISELRDCVTDGRTAWRMDGQRIFKTKNVEAKKISYGEREWVSDAREQALERASDRVSLWANVSGPILFARSRRFHETSDQRHPKDKVVTPLFSASQFWMVSSKLQRIQSAVCIAPDRLKEQTSCKTRKCAYIRGWWFLCARTIVHELMHGG